MNTSTKPLSAMLTVSVKVSESPFPESAPERIVVPAATAVTAPVEELTVATARLVDAKESVPTGT